MVTEAEKVGKPFTLRLTQSRLDLAERIRVLIPGNPEPRSADFFFGLLELVTFTLVYERRHRIKEIKELCERWKIGADDIGFENNKSAG